MSVSGTCARVLLGAALSGVCTAWVSPSMPHRTAVRRSHFSASHIRLADLSDTKAAPPVADPDEEPADEPEVQMSPLERLRAKVAADQETSALVKDEAERIVAFLNAYAADALLQFALQFTEIGETARSKNYWSRGSWVPQAAQVESISSDSISLRAMVQRRGKQELEEVHAVLTLPTPCETADELRDCLLRMASQAGLQKSGAAILQIPGATDRWSLPDNMWLNNTPNQRSVRQMFYDDVSQAVQAAVADAECSPRMRVVITPPELNMEMDAYRVGTLLELVRQIALDLSECGLRVRICVQGSMGEGAFTGLPRVLSGVRKVLEMMDWQAGEGQSHAGVVGDEDNEGLIRFGAIGAGEVAEDDDVYVVLAPQSMVGASIYDPLSAMASAAGSRPLVLINPNLADRPSSRGVMSVRGRSDRIAFADSFRDIYMCRLLYAGTTFMYPIRGALRMSCAGCPMYVLYARCESGDQKFERYVPVGAFDEEPDGSIITPVITAVANPFD